MRKDFIKLANGEYAFTDENGKINLIKCDRGEDFVYTLLCKEEELEGLECKNRIWMNTISRIRMNEKKRKKWKLGYIVLVPLALFLFLMVKPLSLVVALISSLGLLGGYKLFLNYTFGRKKDNKKKIDYANNKYNENRDKIPGLMDEIERLKKESNFRIIDRNNRDNDKKYSYEFRGNSLVNNDKNRVEIVHKARILSYKK